MLGLAVAYERVATLVAAYVAAEFERVLALASVVPDVWRAEGPCSRGFAAERPVRWVRPLIFE